MASETPNLPEGFSKADEPQSNNDGEDFDTEWADRPELGEMVQGTLLAHKPDAGNYDGLLEVRLSQPFADYTSGDLVAIWSTAGINQQLDHNDVRRGEEFAITVEETNDDGNRIYTLYTEDA